MRPDWETIHYNNMMEYLRKTKSLYVRSINKIVGMYDPSRHGRGREFSLDRNPTLKRRVDTEIKKLAHNLEVNVVNAINQEWYISNIKNDQILKAVFDSRGIPPIIEKAIMDRRLAALNSFKNRNINGMNLSDRVWNTAKGFAVDIEKGLALGIKSGTSAHDIALELQQYLNEPDRLYHRVEDEKGALRLSKSAQDYHPGTGIYRSSYKNAQRLTRTEINAAYRTADRDRWNSIDFVLGYEIKRSQNIKAPCDQCDAGQGRYPKSFVWDGWHPNCYSDDTEVYTQRGWLLFKDVVGDDKILSLNRDTKNIEWASILQMHEYHHTGKMYRFHSHNLDMLVTGDHRMVYMSKDGKNRIRDDRTAETYDMVKGGIYRGCEYDGGDDSDVVMGRYLWNAGVYAEFMGYYLSEGSISRKYCVRISQDKEKNEDTYKRIGDLLRRANVPYKASKVGYSIYDQQIWEYLRQYGKSKEKYVPERVKGMSKYFIRIFLDAYNDGDGSRRSKTGANGTRWAFMSREEITYSTQSRRMADGLGELILKVGKRPSYSIMKTWGREQLFRNGRYKINGDQIVIRECYSHTATVFKKTEQEYDGHVYDVGLDRNHILWVRRNGKVAWGSNCMCYMVPIMPNPEDFEAYQDKLWEGIEPNITKSYIDKAFTKADGFKPIPRNWSHDRVLLKK
jgi:hypothetical protein